MKIALDNRAIHFSGIGVYTHNLYQGLNKLGISVILYNDNLLISRQNFIAKYVNFAKRLILEQIYLNKWLVSPNTEFIFGSIPFTGVNLPLEKFNTSKTETDTGFKAEISFSEGCRRTMEW